MGSMKTPAFFTFIAGVLLIFIGIGLKSNGSSVGSVLYYGGFVLMGIFWIWSIVKVVTATDMKPFQKRFWMISVIAAPVIGGLLFHIMHRRAGKIIS
jgi:hypothetical protein